MLNLDFSLEFMTTVPAGIDPVRLADLARFVLEQQAASGEWTVVVAVVSDDHLQRLHLEFMGVDEPTDVMTFPAAEPGGEQSGEIAISGEHALVRSGEWGNSAAEEIEFLMVHGLLHLLGWRDDDERLREAMLQRQSELLRAFPATLSAGEM
jgi:probable rRNA maturation factor